MEINSGHSNVQIAIAVLPQNQPERAPAADYEFDDRAFSATAPSPSANSGGYELGNLINTWA